MSPDFRPRGGLDSSSVAVETHRRDPDIRFILLIACAAVLGTALVLAHEAAHGVRLIGDSLHYIIAARNLLAGQGLLYGEGVAAAHWPPGYPLLLAAASLGVFEPRAVAGPLNAAIFGLTIFVVGNHLGMRLRLRALAVWAAFATALAGPLTWMAVTAISEPAFILLATLALARTDDYLARGRTASLAWAALFAALAWQTRYIGVAVPVAVGLALLLQPGAPPWQRARRASFVWLVAALPMMALWSAFDQWTNAEGIPYPLNEILAEAGAGLVGWVRFGLPPLGWPSLALLAVTAAALMWADSRLVREPRGGGPYEWRTLAVWGGFVLTYLALLVVTIERGLTVAGMLNRYLTPIYVPCLVVVVSAVDRLLDHDRERRRSGGVGGLSQVGRFGRGWSSLPAVVMMVALAFWLAANVERSLDGVLRANRGELHLSYYNGPRWVESETLRYVRDNPVDGRVYSNEPDMLSLHNGGTGTYHRWWPDFSILSDGATVVWFRGWWDAGHLQHSGPPTGKLAAYGFRDWRDAGYLQLLASPMFTQVAELADGLILRVDNRPAFDVELAGKTLTYRKAPCTPADVQARFILQVFPVNPDDLPAHQMKLRKHHLYHRMNFDFRQYGTIRDGECRAVITLPDHDAAGVRTGQRTEAGLLWSAWLADGDAVKGVAPLEPAPVGAGGSRHR